MRFSPNLGHGWLASASEDTVSSLNTVINLVLRTSAVSESGLSVSRVYRGYVEKIVSRTVERNI